MATPRPPVVTTNRPIVTAPPPVVRPPTTAAPRPPVPTGPVVVPPVVITTTTRRPPVPTTTRTSSRAVTTSTIGNQPITPPSTSQSGEGMSGGAVAGLIFGVLAVLVGSVFGGFLLLKQRRKRLMHVGRNQRRYGGYPEPDLGRPPMAAFKREDRPASYRSSGYEVPSSRGTVFETGGPGKGSANSSFTQLSHGANMNGGYRGPVQSSRYSRYGVDNGGAQSPELNPQQQELERQLDLQQQARSLEISGENLESTVHTAGYTPSQSSTSSTSHGSRSPTSPPGPHPHAWQGSSIAPPHDQVNGAQRLHMNRAPFYAGQGGAQPQYAQQQPDSHNGYYESQPIPFGYGRQGHGNDVSIAPSRPYSQHQGSLRQQQQSQQYQPPFPFNARPTVSPRPLYPTYPQPDQDAGRQPTTPPGDKQGHQAISPAVQDPASNEMSRTSHVSGSASPPALTPTSPEFPASSLQSKNSTEPLTHGIADVMAHAQQGNTISETPLSQNTFNSSMGDKEEYEADLNDNPSDVAVPVVGVPSAAPPPLPIATKPKY
ncbi:hypothetical protein BGX34_006695 [Mortierella sp. NVP85]|nr:hypothetical protein BGX34_006695 [Mortierella sp. NVP85]